MTDQAAADNGQIKQTPEQTEEEKRLMEEWELYMSDFVPEDITTIVLESKKEIVYYCNNSVHLDLL